MKFAHRPRSLIALLLLAAGCAGAEKVRLYEGPDLAADKVAVLWSNPHLKMDVDRDFSIADYKRSKLHRIEVVPGHHAVEVSCLYTENVMYHGKGGGPAGKPPAGQQFTESPK